MVLDCILHSLEIGSTEIEAPSSDENWMEGTLAVRALQLNAYSAAIDALRASSNPNHQKTINLLSHLRNVFKISEVIYQFIYDRFQRYFHRSVILPKSAVRVGTNDLVH